MSELTPAQRRAYDFIVQFIAERQYPPSHRDMMEGLGLRTPSATAYHVDILEAKGWIKRDGGARTIRVVRPAA